MDFIESIKEHLNKGEVDLALASLHDYIENPNNDSQDKDMAYYLMGNAYRKKGDFQQALNNYRLSIEMNPDSPAVEAGEALQDILNFYHKDMYNH